MNVRARNIQERRLVVDICMSYEELRGELEGLLGVRYSETLEAFVLAGIYRRGLRGNLGIDMPQLLLSIGLFNMHLPVPI